MALDEVDVATDMLTALTNKLINVQKLPPEVVARLMVGGGAHIFLQHHVGGAALAVAYLRQSADELEALCAPKPPSEIH